MMKKNSIRVRTQEARERAVWPGDAVTFSYRTVLVLEGGNEITVICELHFENVDGVLVAQGPLRVVSVTDGVDIIPQAATKKRLEDVWR